MNNKSKLDYVVNLHKKNTDYLGFIPKPYLSKLVDNGQVFVQEDGGLASGFCIVGNGKQSTIKIYQHCIAEELRNLSLGKKLFNDVSFYAGSKGYNFIHLRCRENLEANKFWDALDFKFLKLEKRKSKRTKVGVNHWLFKINVSNQYLLI
tara:strand:- start:91 stop:540 length:450 start_codon:yes stop_codon:yes gene_type:complete